ncbi:MAG: TrkA C-terminal domain-containing protein [Actinomycetota bacterium]
MLAIITVLAALFISLLVTRIATIALSVTGLSKESARFQARSAFTGVGFTTSEAEKVVNHPVRRRIVLTLMLLGNAGLVTILASLLISFSRADDAGQAWQRIGLLFAGLLAIFLLARSKYVDRFMSRVITNALERFTSLDVQDYAELLQLTGGFGVIELRVEEDHWVAGKTLEELDLRHEGIAVLGIEQGSEGFVGVPAASTLIETGDTLVLYGHTRLLTRLGIRRAGTEGDADHQAARAEHLTSRRGAVTRP